MSLEAAIYNEVRKAASGAPLWVSGMTVAKWQEVRSPLDGEIYRRKTATGGGTTDPADDLTNYIAVSYVRSTTLPLRTPAWTSSASGGNEYAVGISKTAPGVIATGVRTQVLSLTGRGGVGFLGVFSSNNGTALRAEVICDGRTIYDATTTVQSNNFQALTFFGYVFPGTPVSTLRQEGYGISDTNGPRFRRSFQVFLTPTAGTFAAGSALAASYWSES